MIPSIELLKNEERRLLYGPHDNEKVGGLGTNQFIVYCNGNAPLVLERSKEVLLKVNRIFQERVPEDSEWFSLLPEFFVYRCRPERLKDQEEREIYLGRKILEYLSKEKNENYRILRSTWHNSMTWSLLSWVYWFHEGNRYWYWWDSYVHKDSHHILVAVEVHEWPYPSENLSWLFRGCGACYVEAEPDGVND
jgi:hypothetical protein